MESERLREIQAPLKERYRGEPDAAVLTLSAGGELGEGFPQLSTGFETP